MTAAGFLEAEAYCFRRPRDSGEDVVLFDCEPKSFLVYVSHRPKYLDEIDDLYDPLGPKVGAFSYLAPTRMVHEPKEYPCRLAKARDHSFELARTGIQQVALEWLMRIQAPAAFADAVYPDALMYVARASEEAGHTDAARLAYDEMMRRCLAAWKLLPDPVRYSRFEGARVFVYLSRKLGRERGLASAVEQELRYFPEPVPLGGGGWRTSG